MQVRLRGGRGVRHGSRTVAQRVGGGQDPQQDQSGLYPVIAHLQLLPPVVSDFPHSTPNSRMTTRRCPFSRFLSSTKEEDEAPIGEARHELIDSLTRLTRLLYHRGLRGETIPQQMNS